MASDSFPILVTGAAGFIGSRLVRALVDRGDPVCALVRPTTDLWRIRDILPSVAVFPTSLEDGESIRRCVDCIRPRGIVHLAASNIQSGVTAHPDVLVRTNVLGTHELLRAAADIGVDFFLHAGSFLEYGVKERPMRESDLCEPPEFYSITKLSGTLCCQNAARTQGVPVLVFRIFTPYGPAMQHGRVLEHLITRALRGEEISLTQPSVARDFIFVDDLVALFLEGMEKAGTCRGHIFNAGSGHATTLASLAECVLGATASHSCVCWNGAPTVLYDAPACSADMSKTFRYFSWRPAHPLVSGVARTIEWYRTS